MAAGPVNPLAPPSEYLEGCGVATKSTATESKRQGKSWAKVVSSCALRLLARDLVHRAWESETMRDIVASLFG